MWDQTVSGTEQQWLFNVEGSNFAIRANGRRNGMMQWVEMRDAILSVQGTFQTGVWEHWALQRVCDGDCLATFYKDGVAPEINPASSASNPAGKLNGQTGAHGGQGTLSFGGGGGMESIIGKMAEIRLSDVARYNPAGFYRPTASFVSDANTNLLIQEGTHSGANGFKDASSNDHTITKAGDVQVNADAGSKLGIIFGLPCALCKFTLSVWAARTDGAFGDNYYIWSTERGGTGNGMDILSFGGSDNIGFGVQHGNDRVNTAKAYTNPDGVRWNHIVGVFDSQEAEETDRLRLYVNGEQPVKILQNTFSDRTHCIAQLRPGSSFLLSALR